MTQDPEIIAISKVFEALRELNNAQRKRIIEWATDKFGLSEETAETAAGTAAVEETPARDTAPTAPGEAETVSEEPSVTAPPQIEDNKFKEYKTMEDLFLVATVKKNPAKVLLSAAFLQESGKAADLTTRVINAALREIGFGVPNITACLSSLVKKQYLELLESAGPAKRGKSKFQVTPAGLKVAQSYF